MKVHVQHRQDEPKVDRDRGLARQELLDALLDLEVLAVDLVIERDHFLGQLDVLVPERVQRAPERAQDELSFVLQ
jgi:hypothetical protein